MDGRKSPRFFSSFCKAPQAAGAFAAPSGAADEVSGDLARGEREREKEPKVNLKARRQRVQEEERKRRCEIEERKTE
jgi:hypothetical protein